MDGGGGGGGGNGDGAGGGGGDGDGNGSANGTMLPAGTTLTAIVPNTRGMVRAVSTGVQNVSVWLTGTESFSQRNLNMSIADHVDTNREIAEIARKAGIPIRGYISNAVECPFEGEVDRGRVRALAQELQDIGCYEISLAGAFYTTALNISCIALHCTALYCRLQLYRHLYVC